MKRELGKFETAAAISGEFAVWNMEDLRLGNRGGWPGTFESEQLDPYSFIAAVVVLQFAPKSCSAYSQFLRR